ncbi:uncharacterized protein LOC126971987 [Leptidea sinapis]|uniref:uncharacterized protein LOC126971987 n=1 Tax=Leptidea sinapis TaxID=189913 RepID=UPI0021C33556|nr:uncharacterized protein LOC126971987 [Leptidea sinapis]
MPIPIKGKVYKTAVRPALRYGSECWPLMEGMKMLRWSGGVTCLDKVRNEYIRGTLRVRPIPEKLLETRLRWYGHVMRCPDHVTKRLLDINTGPRERGRPRLTWKSVIDKDLQKAKIDPQTTQD